MPRLLLAPWFQEVRISEGMMHFFPVLPSSFHNHMYSHTEKVQNAIEKQREQGIIFIVVVSLGEM
jgi:hypothetical protein